MPFRILVLCIVAVAVAPTSVQADGTLIAWGSQDIEGMTKSRWNEAKTRTVDQVLELNLRATTWAEVYDAILGANANSKNVALRDGLVAQLTNRQVTKLNGTNRLIIWERIASGEILFDGKGMQIDDDLFSVAGRANWVLRRVFKKYYGTVRPNSTARALGALQAKWRKSFTGEAVQEEPKRYLSPKKGLTELRSPQAIVALIASLKDSTRKQEHTKRCLKTLYQLDQLPSPPHPARLCSPDTSAHQFLASVTTVTGQHDHRWWVQWCRKYLAHLKWNPQTAKFDIP